MSFAVNLKSLKSTLLDNNSSIQPTVIAAGGPGSGKVQLLKAITPECQVIIDSSRFEREDLSCINFDETNSYLSPFYEDAIGDGEATILFDDFDSATIELKALVLDLIAKKPINGKWLGKNVIIALAANNPDISAMDIPSAITNRCVIFSMPTS